jgi:hypothetical protein
MEPRYITCPEAVLKFDPKQLREDIADGREIIWDRNGVLGRLSIPVMKNAMQVYHDFREYYSRATLPPHVGRFVWAQTISMAEKMTNPRPDSTGGKGKADEQPLEL